MARSATVSRDTKETQIQVILNIDGGELQLPANANGAEINGERPNKHAFQASKAQYIDVSTGVGFLDHMLHTLAKHAGWSLYLRTSGDLISEYYL